jgi:hypothetical protein
LHRRRRTHAQVSGALIAGSLLLATAFARAQCGVITSSCRQCHELTSEKTFRAGDAWHADHAFADLCANCHAGDPSSADESLAHAGIVDPLGNGGARCGTCHENSAARLGGYRERRGPTPERPTAADPRRPLPSAPPAKVEARGSSSIDTGLSLAAAAIAVFGGAFVQRDLRKRGGGVLPFRIGDIEWSPYFAGALLGLLVAVSMALFGHRLSGGGAYQYLAGVLGRVFAPNNVFFRYRVPARADWELLMVGGALPGAFIAARSSKTFRIRTMPDSGWQAVFGTSVEVRWAVAFLGAALTSVAAGIAGGCTASLAVSGGAALAPGAFAFIAGIRGGRPHRVARLSEDVVARPLRNGRRAPRTPIAP